MTSVSAFTDMMEQFLVELHKTFPEEKGLRKCKSAFDLMKSANPRLLVDVFMARVSPHADKLTSKDETFFIEESKNMDFIKDVNLKTHWGNAKQATKDAIWQYVQTLYMLGTTIQQIDPKTLSVIESVASKMANELGENGGDLDEAQLLKSVQGMLGGMLKK